jgi:hypothetical protein
VKQDEFALYGASEELQNDKEVFLAVVKHKGLLLSHASKELKNDKEIVLAAFKQDGWALNYASRDLQRNRILRIFVKGKKLGQCPRILYWARKRLCSCGLSEHF